MLLSRIHFRFKDIKRFRVKRWKKIFYDRNQESLGAYANIIQNKLESKIPVRDKKYLYNNVSIQQDYITIVNIYTPNKRPSKYI